MIYFTFLRTEKGNKHYADVCWHVGDQSVLDNFRDACNVEVRDDAFECVQVQADGDELSHIEKRFTNLPMVAESRVVTWSGDHAKFIFNNLLQEHTYMLSFLYENENEASIWFTGTVFPNVDTKKKVDFLELMGAELKLAKQVSDKEAFGKSEHQIFTGVLAQTVLDIIMKNRFSFEKALDTHPVISTFT